MASEGKSIPSARIQAILEQLDSAADEYIGARAQIEKARINFELAREKLTLVKRVALEAMDISELAGWTVRHESVQYAGSSIGDAITEVLTAAARQATFAFMNKKADRFDPVLSLEQIEERLEQGGFEFRSVTPKREINAALLKLDSASKVDDGRGYKFGDAWDVLESIGGDELLVAAQAAAEPEVPF